MIQKSNLKIKELLSIMVGLCLLIVLVVSSSAAALNPLPEPDPRPGSFGLEATKPQPPPERGATITTPGNGAAFTTSPITVSGICPDDLLVQVLNNGVMVGAVMCEGGSFSIEVSLFAGTNELSAIVYDDLEQAGPESSIVTVTYTDANLVAFGELVTLTSSYGRRSAAVGAQLTWPLQLSGGTGPYAFSISWGDNTPPELKSQPSTGVVTIAHKYKNAGIYPVNVQVTDVNGVSAFLQVIAVASGQVDGSATAEEEDTEKTTVIWVPAVASTGLLIPAFWLGRRSEVVSLKNRMLKERDRYSQNT